MKRRAMTAHFLPQVFCISHNFEFPELGQTAGLSTREQEAALDRYLAALPTFSERFRVVRSLTSVQHERRHFHDWIGTPYGAHMFYHSQKLLNEFLLQCMPILRQLDTITIPLLDWAGQAGCPPEIAGFAAAYAEHSGILNWYASDFSLPAGYHSDQIVSYAAPDGHPPVPVLRLFIYDEVFVPLGGFAFEEGLAFTLESVLMGIRFGPEYQDAYGEVVKANPLARWYLAALSTFKHMLGDDIPAELFFRACDYALTIAPHRTDFREGHPGWRFLLLVEQFATERRKNERTLRRSIEQLSRSMGWRLPEQTLAGLRGYAGQQIEHNAGMIREQPGLVNIVNLTYYRWLQEVLDARLSGRITLEDPLQYNRSWLALPRTPYARGYVQDAPEEMVGLQCNLTDSVEQDAWLAWIFIWWVFQCLLSGSEPGCPFNDWDDMRCHCPYRTEGCGKGTAASASDPCLYDETLISLGLAGKSINTL